MWENNYYKQSCFSFPSRERMERRERALSSMTFLFALFLGGGKNIFPMPTFHMSQSIFYNAANFHHFLKKNLGNNNNAINFFEKIGLKFAKFEMIFFFNCQISTIGYSTCSHINEGFLKKSIMSSLVEPWQNIGIYDCQLSKIKKLKNKIKIINPNTMVSQRKSFKKSYGWKKGYFWYFV